MPTKKGHVLVPENKACVLLTILQRACMHTFSASPRSGGKSGCVGLVGSVCKRAGPMIDVQRSFRDVLCSAIRPFFEGIKDRSSPASPATRL